MLQKGAGSDSQAWLFTFIASAACIFGTLFIFLDVFLRTVFGAQSFNLRDDRRFLVGGLSLGAGVLLYTALSDLLPDALDYLLAIDHHGHRILSSRREAETVVMASFLAGAASCFLFNWLLHRLTPESIVHCGDDEDGDEEEAPIETSSINDADNVRHAERQLLTKRADTHGGRIQTRMPLIDRESRRSQRPSYGIIGPTGKDQLADNTECAGYSQPCHNEPHCKGHERGVLSRSSSCNSNHTVSNANDNTLTRLDRIDEESQPHHHHVTREQDDMMRIGIQTALAITLHKLPEGFITFITSHADAKMGVSIFLALAIHNVIEGFTIAFPLYLAFRSRTKAILTAVILGGASQPLGAVVAYGVTKVQSKAKLEFDQGANLAYGILFGATSGFMSVIAVQSMLPQAIRNDKQHGMLFTCCFFLGIAIVG